MKKINQETFAKLHKEKYAKIKKPLHPIVLELLEIEKGEIVMVDAKEWDKKGDLKAYMANNQARYPQKFKVFRTKDEKGYVVKRIA